MTLFTACMLAAQPLCAPAAEEQQAIPQLVAREFDGTLFTLRALRGKVVIIHFWATWCPNCIEEMRMLDTFSREHARDDIAILALNIEPPRMRGKAESVMRQFGYGAAMLDDVTASSFETPHALPVTYVVGKAGKVEYVFRPDQHAMTLPALEVLASRLLHE